MQSTFSIRPAIPADAPVCLELRGKTRENAVSAQRLAEYGITAESWHDDIESGALPGHVVLDEGEIVGYCFANKDTGEIAVLATLPNYEGKGIGRELLGRMIGELWLLGFKRLFLGCSPDPATRSYGFYRHLGWKSTGTFDAHGDEVLELQLEMHDGRPNSTEHREA